MTYRSFWILYEVRWAETVACSNGSGGTTAGGFSVVSQPLSTSIATRYTAGATPPTCTSTTVVASLYLAGGTEVLDSITIAVTLAEISNVDVTPDLGVGNGDGFFILLERQYR